MPKTKQIFEEERAFLLTNEEGLEIPHRHSYPAFETAIAKGVTNHVGKWPSHLFAAFLAASLVFAVFILFALVTALFCIPTATYRCRFARNADFPESPNIYFVKHENRTWSQTELCYVESSARDNPEVNVYLINLLTNGPEENGFALVAKEKYEEREIGKRGMIEMLVSWEKIFSPVDKIHLSPSSLKDEAIRRRLDESYANLRNIDVTIKDFFKGSMLTNVFRDLDTNTLEIAAKANILWNSPGIALDPLEFRHIRDSERYLCKRGCKVIKDAAINPEGSFQASGVPCQAFLGYLIRQIATKNSSTDRDIVKRTREKFCQSFRKCPGLEIYNDAVRSSERPYCPTIYPSGIPVTKIRG